MPEPPDFDQMALDLMMVLHSPPAASDGPAIREQLRQVWNARGAADLAALEPLLGVNLDDETRVIRRLDR